MKEIMMSRAMRELPSANTTIDESYTEDTKNVFIAPLGRMQVLSGFDKSKMIEEHIEEVKKSMRKVLSLECPTFLPQKALPGMTLYFSHDFPFRNLEQKNISDNVLINQRNNTESFIYSYSSGLLIDAYRKNRATLQLGLNYSQINQKFLYSNKNTSQIKTIKIVEYILIDGQIVDSVVTEEKINVPGTLNIENGNKYKSVDVPILLNYHLLQRGKIGFSITAGASFNLLYTQEGRIMSGNSAYPVQIGNGIDNNPYKTNAGISIVSGFNVHYRLLRNLDIQLSPMFKYNLGYLTNQDYSLNEKHMVAGLSTGIKINL
jgi:hypothetical protein